MRNGHFGHKKESDMRNIAVFVLGAFAAIMLAACESKEPAPPPADVIEQPDTIDECPRADGQPCL